MKNGKGSEEKMKELKIRAYAWNVEEDQGKRRGINVGDSK